VKRYRYSGPPSGVTAEDREVLLHPGGTVDLDPANSYTAALLAQGYLTEEPAAATAPRKSKPEGGA